MNIVRVFIVFCPILVSFNCTQLGLNNCKEDCAKKNNSCYSQVAVFSATSPANSISSPQSVEKIASEREPNDTFAQTFNVENYQPGFGNGLNVTMPAPASTIRNPANLQASISSDTDLDIFHTTPLRLEPTTYSIRISNGTVNCKCYEGYDLLFYNEDAVIPDSFRFLSNLDSATNSFVYTKPDDATRHIYLFCTGTTGSNYTLRAFSPNTGSTVAETYTTYSNYSLLESCVDGKKKCEQKCSRNGI